MSGPTNDGNGALDVNGTFTISGGALLAAGSSGMAVAPASSSTQDWVAMTFTSSQPAGTVVHIVAADGQVVASFTAREAFTSLVYSSAEISSGASYSVYTSGTVSGDGVGGLVDGGDLSGATVAGTFTAGTAPAGGMGMGGGPGGAAPGAGG